MVKKDKRMIEGHVKDIIVQQLFGIDEQERRKAEIRASTNIVCDLNADSLDLVELVMAVEDEFMVEIPDEDAGHFVTVGDIVLWLEKHINSSTTIYSTPLPPLVPKPPPTVWDAFLEYYGSRACDWSPRRLLMLFWHYCQNGLPAVEKVLAGGENAGGK